MAIARFFILLFLFALAGSLKAETSSDEFTVGGFIFGTPKSWQIVPPSSSMRKAELIATDEKTKESAETVFFCFGPGQGGSVEDNIARWKGQFTDPGSEKVVAEEIAGIRVTLVKFAGTYQSGMPGGPKLPQTGSMLLGAILEGPEGSIFVRLTGPAGWVEKIEKDFDAMIETGAKNRKG